VSADTVLERFREFCGIIHKYGITQVHGVLLRGQTNSNFVHEGASVEYPGLPTSSTWPNDMIRKLAEPIRFEVREDLINYLRDSRDEVALHGFYHTDYSAMSASEQREEIAKGLELLKKLFPDKAIRYFIAPFNRTNEHTRAISGEFGLEVLAADGVHLEERLHKNDLQIEPDVWYRYHHHRFYPESTVRYYKLSLEALDTALARNFRSR
jgi:peptidoglycan/xylan/chitin deacetylase (PgdA/CDA1 family)